MSDEKEENEEKEEIFGEYKLQCGHAGNIIWKSGDEKIIGVKGTNHRCSVCGVIKEYIEGGSKRKEWNPTVYLIQVEEAREKK